MSLDAARKRLWKEATRHLWRALVAVVGVLVLLVGIVMIVTPGPAILVIPMGLGILATQFHWARRVLHHFHDRALKITKPVNAAMAAEPPRAANEDCPSHRTSGGDNSQPQSH